jgi:hypothetical protein
LIRAVQYQRVVHDPIDDGEYGECTTAAAAAEAPSSLGTAAKAAVPVLIEAAQSRENHIGTWELRVAAIRALGEFGHDAQAAIPVLRSLLKDEDKSQQDVPEIIAALYRLETDGRALAETWINRPPDGQLGPRAQALVEGRAMGLGAMGRTSVEADWLIRSDLRRLESMFADDDPLHREVLPMHIGEWFEKLGRFGVGGHLAIPWLREFQNHSDPWIRMWATEAIARITLNVKAS